MTQGGVRHMIAAARDYAARMPRTGGMAIEIVPLEPQVGNGRLQFRLTPSRVFYSRELYDVPSFRIMAVGR